MGRRRWRSAGSRATGSTCRSRRRGRESCPDCAGLASVSLFENGIWLVERQSYSTTRLILLDLPDGGSVVIAINGKQVDAAMPVVRSFEFDLS